MHDQEGAFRKFYAFEKCLIEASTDPARQFRRLLKNSEIAERDLH